MNIVSKDKQMYLWHNMLGHTSIDVLRNINADFVNKGRNNCDPYDVCATSKQHRLSFPLSQIVTKDPFELIHPDVWDHILRNQLKELDIC